MISVTDPGSLPLAVLNPNSSESVTRTIAEAVRAAQGEKAHRFEYVTLHEGPPGIVSQADADVAAAQVQAWVRQHGANYAAITLACFSDPGLGAARTATVTSIVGLGEAGMRTALDMGRRVGVLAVASAAIPRHMRYWAQLGVADRVAGERAIDLTVAQSGDHALAFERLRTAGLALRDEDGADVLLLGCAGMANLCAPLQDALGMQVVEPCAAAAQAAWALRGTRAE